MRTSSADLIMQLSDAFGPAGFEHEVRELIREMVAPYCDEVRVDVLGNLIALKRGAERKCLMLDAHMDEIGFMVQHISDDGFLRFVPLGGWDPRVLLTHRVTIGTREQGKVTGVIGAAPPHILDAEEKKKAPKIDDMFIDIGASSAAEAASMGVRVGDPIVISYPATALRDGWILGKALDDRAGCAVVVSVLRELARTDHVADIVCTFTVCEEVGLRGAKTAAEQVAPDIALAIEGTIGADFPGVPAHKRPTALGKGPAITVADGSTIVSRELVASLEHIATSQGIPWQYKLPAFGGTNAGAIHLTGKGVRTGVVSVPCRYIHSPHSLLRLDDFEYTVQLVCGFALQSHDLIACGATPEEKKEAGG